MRLSLLGASALLSIMASPTYAADTGGGGGAADTVAKTDGVSTPKPGDPASADPQPDPGAGGGPGPAPAADPNPPTNKDDAKGKGKGKAEGKYVVWAQPGHEAFGIGQMLLVPAEVAESLRAAGRARYASEAEVKAGAKTALQVDGV